jgi:hypothetical protein
MVYVGQTSGTLDRISSNLEQVTSKVFNLGSIVLFLTLILLSFLVGRVIAFFLRRLTVFFSQQADKTSNLTSVERWRRAETMLIISIAIIRVLLFAFAVYLWWLITHPGQQPTAIVGASVIFAVIAGGVFGPVLRDLASGSVMMAEHWFGVGDHIRVEPFVDMQGIVERITLRSTRLRDLNGEVIWINNQNIQAVRVATKGLRTVAIELFVSHLDDGQKLVEQTDLRLPGGRLMVASPLRVMSANQVASNMWHITAIGQTAPGREWLLEKYAIEVMHELDSNRKVPVLKSDPIARNADSEAETKFARAFKNASKVRIKPAIKKHLKDAAKRERAEIQKKRAARHSKNN